MTDRKPPLKIKPVLYYAPDCPVCGASHGNFHRSRACFDAGPLPPTGEEWLQGRIDFLEASLDELLYDDVISSGRHRELTGFSPEWQRERWRAQLCANCGHKHLGNPPVFCRDCDWRLTNRDVPNAPLCSICRRRHGSEVTHACE